MKKRMVELAAGLECGIFATKPTIKDAFDFAVTFNDVTVTTAVHVLANTIAKELRKMAITPASDNKRQAVMVELIDTIDDEFNHYEEGLTTDIECARKIVCESLEAFSILEKCTVCEAPNDGNHFETYGGNLCTSCNPDKRVFTVSYGKGFPVQPPVLKYRHQLVLFEGLDRDDEMNIDNLNPGEMTDVYLDNDRRMHVMRTA